MGKTVVVWYDADENAVKFANEEYTLSLNKPEFKLVIPVKSSILWRVNNEEVEEELVEFYLQGYGEIVLIVSPKVDRIGFIFTKEELRQLALKIPAFNSLNEHSQESTEDLRQQTPSL
ncbi:hypothetical protein [Thermococcus sp.]|uniref:hypothetical protein n=1 Tax=Thermococcus sp. TaxID=35749 RepID=UPI002617064E|nr:hypothetical protein [Thermococcus sp.]